MPKELDQKTINETVKQLIPADAWPSTVAVVIARGKTVAQFGTGILLRIADDYFLVTAGHVFRDAKNQALGLAAGRGKIIRLTGESLSTDEDPFDVAVHKLSQDVVTKLDGCTFLTLNDIDTDPQPERAVFTLFGYPAVWSAPSGNDSQPFTIKPLEFTTYAYDRETSALTRYEPKYHLLLEAQPGEITTEDGGAATFKTNAGIPASFPGEVGGISGCSVWRIGNLDVPINEWGRERPRVVGVQTGVYGKKAAIKATRWIAVSTLIHGAFPHLRPAMSLWRHR